MEYLTNLEDFFTTKTQKIGAEFKKFIDKEPDDEMRSMAEQAQHENLRGVRDFENLFRKSFVANIYSFLEDQLVSECHKLKSKDDEPLNLSSHDVLDQIKTYFKKSYL